MATIDPGNTNLDYDKKDEALTINPLATVDIIKTMSIMHEELDAHNLGIEIHGHDRITFSNEALFEFLKKLNRTFKERFGFPGNHFLYKDLTEIANLGQGTFGSVKKVLYTKTLTYFAKKVISYQPRFQTVVIGEILPLMYLSEIADDSLLKIVRVEYEPDKNFEIIMECGLGTLEDLTQFLVNNGFMYETLMQDLSMDLTKQLSILEEYDLCHRDIKPENIIISNDFQFKLTDFGCCEKRSKHIEQKMYVKGTVKYMTPELQKAWREQTECMINPYEADKYATDLVLKITEKRLENCKQLKKREEVLKLFKVSMLKSGYDNISDLSKKDQILEYLFKNKMFEDVRILIKGELETIEQEPEKILRVILLYGMLGDVAVRIQNFEEGMNHYRVCSDLIIENKHMIRREDHNFTYYLIRTGKACLRNEEPELGLYYLEIYIKEFHDESHMRHVINCHDYIATCYIKLKRFEEASRHVDIMADSLKSMNINEMDNLYFRVFKANGFILKEQGNYIEAAECLHRALQLIFQEFFEDQHKLYEVYTYLAEIYLSKEFSENPGKVYSKLFSKMMSNIKLYSFKQIPSHMEIEGSLAVIKDEMIKTTKTEDLINIGLRYKKDAINIIASIIGDNTIRVAKEYLDFGSILLNLSPDFYETAKKTLEVSLKIFEKRVPENDLQIAECLSKLGEAIIKAGRYTSKVSPSIILDGYQKINSLEEEKNSEDTTLDLGIQKFKRALAIRVNSPANEVNLVLQSHHSIIQYTRGVERYIKDTCESCKFALSCYKVISSDSLQFFMLYSLELVRSGKLDKVNAEKLTTAINEILAYSQNKYSYEFLSNVYFEIGKLSIKSGSYAYAISSLQSGLEYALKYTDEPRTILPYYQLLLTSNQKVNDNSRTIDYAKAIVDLSKRIINLNAQDVREAYLLISKHFISVDYIKEAIASDIEFARLQNVVFEKATSPHEFYLHLAMAYASVQSDVEYEHYSNILNQITKSKLDKKCYYIYLKGITSQTNYERIKAEESLRETIKQLGDNRSAVIVVMNFISLLLIAQKEYEKAAVVVNDLLFYLNQNFNDNTTLIIKCLQRVAYLYQYERVNSNSQILQIDQIKTISMKFFATGNIPLLDAFETYGLLKEFNKAELHIILKGLLSQVNYENIPGSIYLVMSVYSDIKQRASLKSSRSKKTSIRGIFPFLASKIFSQLFSINHSEDDRKKIVSQVNGLTDLNSVVYDNTKLFHMLAEQQENYEHACTFFISTIEYHLQDTINVDLYPNCHDDVLKMKITFFRNFIKVVSNDENMSKSIEFMITNQESLNFDTNQIYESYLLLGLCHIREKNFLVAITQLEKLVNFIKKRKKKEFMLIKPYILIALAYIELKKMSEGIKFIEEAYNLQLNILEGEEKINFKKLSPSLSKNGDYFAKVMEFVNYFFGENLDYLGAYPPAEKLSYTRKDKKFCSAIEIYLELFSQFKTKFRSLSVDKIIQVKSWISQLLGKEGSKIIGFECEFFNIFPEKKRVSTPFNFENVYLPESVIKPIYIDHFSKFNFNPKTIEELLAYIIPVDEEALVSKFLTTNRTINSSRFRLETEAKKIKRFTSVLKNDSITTLLIEQNIVKLKKLVEIDDYDLEIARLHEWLSLLHAFTGNFNEAVKTATISLEIKSARADPENKSLLVANVHHLIGIIYNIQGYINKSLEFHKKALEIKQLDPEMDSLNIILAHQLFAFTNYQHGYNNNSTANLDAYFNARLDVNNSREDQIGLYNRMVSIIDLPQIENFQTHLKTLTKAINDCPDLRSKGHFLDILGFITFPLSLNKAEGCHGNALECKISCKAITGLQILSFEYLASIAKQDHQALGWVRKCAAIDESNQLWQTFESIRLASFNFEMENYDEMIRHHKTAIGKMVAFSRTCKSVDNLNYNLSMLLHISGFNSDNHERLFFPKKSHENLEMNKIDKDHLKLFLLEFLGHLSKLEKKSLGPSKDSILSDPKGNISSILEISLYTTCLELQTKYINTGHTRFKDFRMFVKEAENCWQKALCLRFIAEVYKEQAVPNLAKSCKYYDQLKACLIQLVGKDDEETDLLLSCIDNLTRPQVSSETFNQLGKMKMSHEGGATSYKVVRSEKVRKTLQPQATKKENKYLNQQVDLRKYYKEALYWRQRYQEFGDSFITNPMKKSESPSRSSKTPKRGTFIKIGSLIKHPSNPGPVELEFESVRPRSKSKGKKDLVAAAEGGSNKAGKKKGCNCSIF